ncbi:MAG TPA: efflux RND transporter periplasmic adaptor subunit [Longimicrobiales bacterium]
MSRRTKIGIGAVALLVIGGIGALAAAGGAEGTQVRVETVVRRDLVATVTGNGWIRPHRRVDIQADIMGRITSLRVAEGDSVKRGQVLLRIDPTQYQAAVARARAAVAEALAREAQNRANLIQAERTLERSRALAQRDTGFISRQQLEEAETQVLVQRELMRAAEHGVEQARAALREAEDRLAKTTIVAPIDGVVTRLNIEEGETAIVGTMNNPGSLLLTISDLSVMEAVVRVDETDVPELALGDSATIEIDAFPRRTFTGRVTEIAHSSVRPPESMSSGPGSQAQAVDFEVILRLDDPPPVLRPDFSATAEIVTDIRKGVLSIPIIALAVRDRGRLEAIPQEDASARAAAADVTEHTDIEGVFVVRQGTAHFVPVEVGIAGAEHFEVLSGLAEGDSVVAGPYEAIRALEDGAPIRIMAQPADSNTNPSEDSI